MRRTEQSPRPTSGTYVVLQGCPSNSSDPILTTANTHYSNVLLQSADPRGQQQQQPAQEEWAPAYNECDPLNGSPWLFKLLRLDDVTLCLDERTLVRCPMGLRSAYACRHRLTPPS